MAEDLGSDLSKNTMPDLPVKENAWDRGDPNYSTTIVWENMEHFIHAPKDHDLRNFSRKELKDVNWPAIKVAWQRHLKRLYETEGQYLEQGTYFSRIGWDEAREESGGNYVYHNWEA